MFRFILIVKVLLKFLFSNFYPTGFLLKLFSEFFTKELQYIYQK